MRIYITFLLLSLAGCSLAPLGDSDFSCPRDRYGVHCLAAREVYQATNTTDRLGAAAAAPTPAPVESTAGEHWVERNGKSAPAPAGNGTMTAATTGSPPAVPPAVPRPDDPLPLRTPAQVLRIWVAPFEDDAGNLHAPGYVFAEVVPRRWQLGEPALAAGEPTPALTALQVERREAPPAAAATKGAAAPFDLLGPREGDAASGAGSTLGTGSGRRFSP